jgi:protein involved in polysaccharide export with SLBB domain
MTLTVDPQGRIVNQTLGVIDLTHQTLAQAQTLLTAKLADHYKAGRIEISVSEPRRIAVQVSGAVAQPGTYKGFTSLRASEVIEHAGGVLHHGSTRRIEMTGGPAPLTVDLDRAEYLGDNSYNPCLYAGYGIHVPSKSIERVQVVGEVNQPREIELAPGDDLTTLIALAGGATSHADTERVMIANRTSADSPTPDPVRPGDIIEVPRLETASDRDMLRVFGAVGRPGKYPFRDGADLEDLIERAGGFGRDASIGLVTLFRRARTDEWGRLNDRRYPITGAVGADGSIMAMLLLPGDSVYVPYLIGYVKVSGEVLNPGRYPYVEGKDALFYVKTAGGFLPKAKKIEVSVYNRIAKTTSEFPIGVLVHDGDELVINVREELQ